MYFGEDHSFQAPSDRIFICSECPSWKILKYVKRLMVVLIIQSWRNALCFDVNIQNVSLVHSSAWASSWTNKTVNLFSLCACINLWDMPLSCCGFAYFITMVQGAPASVLQLCHCPLLSLFTSYQGSLRCGPKLFSFPLITLHFCLHHSCMKLAISWFSGTYRVVIL